MIPLHQLKPTCTNACFMNKAFQTVCIDGSVCRTEFFWYMALKISKTDLLYSIDESWFSIRKKKKYVKLRSLFKVLVLFVFNL